MSFIFTKYDFENEGSTFKNKSLKRRNFLLIQGIKGSEKGCMLI